MREDIGRARQRCVVAVAVVSSMLAFACGSGDGGNPVGRGETKSTLAGFAGGFVGVAGAALTIPTGALRPDTNITITSTTMAPPAGARTWSPVYKFEPEGLIFSGPATIEIDVRGAGANAAILWSRAAGGYEMLTTQVANGKARASVRHFSYGFVVDSTVPFPGFGEGQDAGRSDTSARY